MINITTNPSIFRIKRNVYYRIDFIRSDFVLGSLYVAFRKSKSAQANSINYLLLSILLVNSYFCLNYVDHVYIGIGTSKCQSNCCWRHITLFSSWLLCIHCTTKTTCDWIVLFRMKIINSNVNELISDRMNYHSTHIRNSLNAKNWRFTYSFRILRHQSLTVSQILDTRPRMYGSRL